MTTAGRPGKTDITAAHIDGPFQPGSSCEWTSYGFTVVSTIHTVADAPVCCGVGVRLHHWSPRVGLQRTLCINGLGLLSFSVIDTTMPRRQ
jgi:hypothetical protein